MKPTMIHIGWLLAGLCTMASCQKEMLVNESSDRLPEGLFPVELNLNGCQPSTSSRITEARDGITSFWSEGDQVGIALKGGGNDATAIGTLTAEGEMMYTTLYWKTTKSAKVSAWYPAGKGTISLQDQRRKLVYLLKTDMKECNYLSGPVNLEFNHQLAKIRIIVKGGFSWLRSAELSFLGYTTCTYNDGNFVFGEEKDYLAMRSVRSRQRIFEIQVAPMQIKKGEKTLKITFWNYQRFYAVDEEVALKAGHLYTLNMDANWFN